MSDERYETIGRQLTVRYVSCLAAAILLLLAQVWILDLVRFEVLVTDTLAVCIFGPPLILVAYAPVRHGFRRIRDAALSGDHARQREAIELALALPSLAARAYLATWVIAFLTGIGLSAALVGLSSSEVAGHVLTFAGLLFVAGFPLYAVVENALRPVLRDLFESLAGNLKSEAVNVRRFGITLRVAMAMSELVIASLFFLGSRPIIEGLGISVPPGDVLRITLLEVPLLAAMTLMVGWAITSSVGGSIGELTGEIRAAAAGDLRRRTPITTTDELGALMLDVDQMLVNQAGLIGSTADVAREVTLSAGAVAEGSEQSSQGVSEIAHAMQDVVLGAQVQFEQIGTARGAADALSAAIEQATMATAKATEVSAGARVLADEGSASAIEARSAMEQMQQTITDATSAVDRLGGDTADIGTIVDSIVTIADQTNLLALNAAIEAARAGEAGRGFAVVAEEVRQLASESNEEAAKIGALIKNIEQTVSDTVEAVNDGNSEVMRGVTVVDAAGAKFTDIAGALQTIGTHVGEINSRTDEVAAATSAVSEAVEQILQVTESVAALAEQTSANTEEASASSQEITSSAEMLRSMAHELEAQIAVFKV